MALLLYLVGYPIIHVFLAYFVSQCFFCSLDIPTPMGGNLFKLGRLPKDEYLKVEATIKPYLDKKLGGFYRIPRYYFSKPDFGDLDIIVSSEVITDGWDTLKAAIIQDLALKGAAV